MLIGAVGVGLEDRARAGTVEDGRYAGGGVVARVGIERHPGWPDGDAEDLAGVSLDRAHQPARLRQRPQRLGKQDSSALNRDARRHRGGTLDQLDQRALDRGAVLLRNDAAVDTKRDAIGNDVGIDAARNQADRDLRRADAAPGAHDSRQSPTLAVDRGEDRHARLERIDARGRHRGMRLAAAYGHLEMEDAVVRHGDGV